MPRELRDTSPGKLHLLSCRTLYSELLFIPKPPLNEIVGGVVARYQEFYNIDIFGISVLGNHYHILCRSLTGQIHLFAENINREIAHRVNRYLGRTGPVWSRRYDDLVVLEDKDTLEALLYVVTNPTKHFLVENPKSWPGICSYRQSLGAKPKQYKFFKYTEYHAALKLAKNSGDRVKRSDFEVVHTLVITPVNRISGLERVSYATLRSLLAERVAKLVKERRAAGKGFLGRKNVLAQPIRGKFPFTSSKSKRPICYTKNIKALGQYRKERKILRAAYRDSSISFRSGNYLVEFPAYTIRPPLHHIPKQAELHT